MNPIQKIVEYVRSSKSELEKVAWPSKQDTIRYSALVIGVSVFVAVFFAFLDAGLGKGVEVLLTRAPATASQTTPPITPDVTSAQPDVTAQPIEATGITPEGKTIPVKVTPIK